MTTQATRNLVTVVAAVVITALIVGASTFLVVSSGPKTITITSNVTPSSGRLYEVVFKQSGTCTPTAYEVPWSVTLGPWTVAEPSNASVPLDTGAGYAGPEFVNESVIVFSVPNGQYPYNVTAVSGFGNSTGVVNVDGADVMVLLEGPFTGCTMSTATSTTITETTGQTSIGCSSGSCVTSAHDNGDSISVGPLSICPTNCVYPSPYVSGQVLVNATTPLLTLTVYVNGTFDGTPINNTAGEALTGTVFAYEYKGSMPSSLTPVVPGDTYAFTFIAGFEDGSSASGTSYVTVGASTSTSLGGGTIVLVQQGTTYQVQASYDCVAGHMSVPFNVTTASTLFGAIAAGSPGVTLYVATAQDAQSVSMGHPTSWVYTSGVTSSTSFNIPLGAGSYVLWTEGADLNCGATVVTPLEQLVNVTVTQAIGLTPP